MESKSVCIVVKSHDKIAAQVADKIVLYLLDYTNCHITIDGPKSGFSRSIKNSSEVEFDNFWTNHDLIVAIGGDGTILRSVRYIKDKIVPVIGINVGRVGYLATTPYGFAVDTVSRFLSNPDLVTTEQRQMIKVKSAPITTSRGSKALNEVVLHWSKKARLVNFKIEIEGDGEFETRADGIIVSTPTGSTAYNYAAGGPLVHHDINAITLTPICPFSGLKGSLMLPSDTKLKITSDTRNSEISVTVDGHADFVLKKGRFVTIEKCPIPFVLVSNSRGYGYLKTLQSKLSVIQNSSS